VPFEELGDSHPSTECAIFVAVGYTQLNARRAAIFNECVTLGYELVTLVSSRAHCWDDLSIGRNCLIFDGAIVEPNVVIGDDVIVWSGSQISHDASVGAHAFVGPNAVVLGDASIGPRSFIGGNATVRNGVSVAEDCVVGAGAVVKRDTKRGEVYSADQTPARPGRNSMVADS
jgi:sugar O-acyltransferase (sialic acid O-acetyltransferase NeuD family)